MFEDLNERPLNPPTRQLSQFSLDLIGLAKLPKVYFILYLMNFKYVPLPAQHFFMANWDTCLGLLGCFWDLEGPRVFGRVCVSLFLFIKKTYPLWNLIIYKLLRTFLCKYSRYYTYLNFGREVARIWISSSIKWNRL